MKHTLFITGTDTGAGKTVLTCLLLRCLREQGINAAALKPVCSGGREDAKKIFAAMNGTLSLEEINPWHFRAPIAPLLAARKEKKKIQLPRVLAHLREMQKRFDVLVVEGAGGLLSPLGEGFDSRELIGRLPATPIIVAQNRLGVLNQVLLIFEALPKNLQGRAKVVLMSSARPDASAATNAVSLAEFIPAPGIFSLPRFGKDLRGALDDPLTLKKLRTLLS